jgi:hypothetical protein
MNRAEGMSVCIYYVFVLSFIDGSLEVDRSPSKVVLPTVYMIKEELQNMPRFIMDCSAHRLL